MRIEEMVHDAKDAQREERSQVVHVAASLQGRTALIKGSCTVRSSYLPLVPKPAEFGIATYNGRRYAAVREEGNDYWEAVEAEPEWSYRHRQAALLRGGNT